MRILLEGQLKGEFHGFNENMLFCFTNNTFWLQTRYWYHYAYRPYARIIEEQGQVLFEINGNTIPVKKITNVIESQIENEFNGWDGESVYELTNGQKWKQSEYKYEYQYAYRPECIIYEGTDGYIMYVDGTNAHVERIE